MVEVNEGNTRPIEIDLKEQITEFVLKEGDMFLLIEQTKHIIEKGEDSYFNPSELSWIQYKVDFLSKVIHSEVASGIFYWLKNHTSKREWRVIFWFQSLYLCRY